MIFKYGKFKDPYRGNGVFFATGKGRRHVLLAVRKTLNFGFRIPNGKPDFRRLYLGLLEIQYS